MVERPLSMREVPGSTPGFSIILLFSNMQRVIRTLQQAQTARQEAQFYDEYKAKLNILYPSHQVICQFMATTNITKTPCKFSSPEFPFLRRNKAAMSRTSNHPLINCNKNSLRHFHSGIYSKHSRVRTYNFLSLAK